MSGTLPTNVDKFAIQGKGNGFPDCMTCVDVNDNGDILSSMTHSLADVSKVFWLLKGITGDSVNLFVDMGTFFGEDSPNQVPEDASLTCDPSKAFFSTNNGIDQDDIEEGDFPEGVFGVLPNSRVCGGYGGTGFQSNYTGGGLGRNVIHLNDGDPANQYYSHEEEWDGNYDSGSAGVEIEIWIGYSGYIQILEDEDKKDGNDGNRYGLRVDLTCDVGAHGYYYSSFDHYQSFRVTTYEPDEEEIFYNNGQQDKNTFNLGPFTVYGYIDGFYSWNSNFSELMGGASDGQDPLPIPNITGFTNYEINS